jgi:FdhD protein
LVFSVTGGIHATALFDEKGKLELIQEDVGRHNAFDKAVGKKLLNENIPLTKNIGLVSGRTSFELLQKAVMAGLPILCAIGAPSSLAVELAEEFNITLIGFLKENRFNIYSNPERIIT